MEKFTFLSIDSSLANTGIAVGYIDKGRVIVERIALSATKRSKNKTVRVSSDTINRCRDTYNFVRREINKAKPRVIFAETPSGSQNASSMKSYGVTCMLIAALPWPPIEVTPQEVKKAVGYSSKEDIIEWANAKYPDLEWRKHKDGALLKTNEHMADAIAIAHAGIETPEFKRIRFSGL